ncbi:hypothetical protein BDU57DRAFT_501299 [Ampelomyces quisqualis]|uniref:Uncharacterized protein n=1 Tax=Ampelomyces quisqualis TaxID=50730 RepID=A0A6A5QIP1_AMPQU|nr:hypothetical protein BDU57DRAFT_501299 [Ampelomyces quisqualis]
MPDSNPHDEETRHIPPTADPAKEEEKEEQSASSSSSSGGLLSAIGDPAGKVLQTTLRPLGAPLEKTVTGPLGSALGGTTRGVVGPLLGHDEERMEGADGGESVGFGSIWEMGV